MTLPCPRRLEVPDETLPEAFDHWRDDETCSYCGSLSPALFLSALGAGALLIPTMKSYEVMVRMPHPLAGQETVFSIASGEVPGYEILTPERADQLAWEASAQKAIYIGEWVSIGTFPEHEDKTFYFQHLTRDQKIGFIEMLNAGLVTIDGGGFPLLPYFVARPQSVTGGVAGAF